MIEPKRILDAIQQLHADRWKAHQKLFATRHQFAGKPTDPAEFHPEIVADFWGRQRFSQVMAFRGSAKSTLAEEDIVLLACYGLAHNIVVLGSSETRAAERLAAVSYELLTNDFILELFGPQKGQVWTQTKLVTTSNVCIQALGRDQDIRGIKHLDFRPDFVLVDDFEDKDNVQTPEGRKKTLRWFLAELIPACAPHCKVRVRATPMDAESVPMELMRTGWPTKIFPIEVTGDDGKPHPTWAAGGYTAEWIAETRGMYERLGELGTWDREYMCRAVSDADRVFRAEQIRVVPQGRTWQATYAMIDPARTVGRNSATTGWAVWSWLRNRLVVWAADAQLLLPDEIVALGFDIAERFDPVWLGVEQDGLEEFLMQPFRREMAKSGMLPLKGVRAPRGKLDFIRGLQPFFAAGEVEFVQELPALKEQLLNFPRGRIDAPNALAYALQMRPGMVVYENFNDSHITAEPSWNRSRPLYLAANATPAWTTAVLLQNDGGRLVVLTDWVAEGSPMTEVPRIWNEAAVAADAMRKIKAVPGRSWSEMLKTAVPDEYVTRQIPPSWVVPDHHGDRWGNVGLLPAIRGIPAEHRFGGDVIAGRTRFDGMLTETSRGLPIVEIAPTARWTLRALSGGYAREMRNGRVQEEAEAGPYRLLMEGLESFLGLGAGMEEAEPDDIGRNYAYDRFGQRYQSAMPQRR